MSLTGKKFYAKEKEIKLPLFLSSINLFSKTKGFSFSFILTKSFSTFREPIFAQSLSFSF